MSSAGKVLTEDEASAILARDLSEACTVVDYSVEPASSSPNGFLGEHNRLRIRFRRPDGFLSQRNYFFKTIPDGDPSRRDYLLRLGCFYKEIAMYDTVFRRFREAAPKIPKWHPECLFVRGDDVIVLEDLAHLGYAMYPERELMDDDHVLRSLEALAAMHASSMVFEHGLDDSTTIGDLFGEYLFEAAIDAGDSGAGSKAQEVAIAAQVKLVDLLPGYTEQQKEIIKRELPAQLRRQIHLSKPSRKFRNVIVHGDLWSNNVLFLEGSDGRVLNAQIVDFQLTRYAPPAQDLAAFLYLVQSRRYREENRERLLRHYHGALSSCLAESGLSVDDFLTWSELSGSCDYYEEFGLVTAVFFFQLILIPRRIRERILTSSELFMGIQVADRSDVVAECYLGDDVYRERVTEVMAELIDGYIL